MLERVSTSKVVHGFDTLEEACHLLGIHSVDHRDGIMSKVVHADGEAEQIYTDLKFLDSFHTVVLILGRDRKPYLFAREISRSIFDFRIPLLRRKFLFEQADDYPDRVEVTFFEGWRIC